MRLQVDVVDRVERVWFRQLDIDATSVQEGAVLATVNEYGGRAFPRKGALAKWWLLGRVRRSVPLEDLYCAELVATTFERVGLLGSRRQANWYDPGRFWSGDRLALVGATLGPEIEISAVPAPPSEDDR